MEIPLREREFQQVVQYVTYMRTFRETPSSLRCKLRLVNVEVVRQALEWCVSEGTLQKRSISSDTLYYRAP